MTPAPVLFDASLVIDIFITSANTPRLVAHLARHPTVVMLTDFAMGEFGAAVSRRVRTGLLAHERAARVLEVFDAWTATDATPVVTDPSDIRSAALHVRRGDMSLRMPDAIYLATAMRLRLPLATFDRQQSEAARRLGIPLVAIAEVP
jgi:predicted nucleic acid-binding protein